MLGIVPSQKLGRALLDHMCPMQGSWVAILRVNQMDAARLDLEMKAMLKEQLVKVFSLCQVSSLVPTRKRPNSETWKPSVMYFVGRFS